MALHISADSRAAKLKTSFQNLSSASKILNDASDAFGGAITSLDEALNNLNPGVRAWVTVSSSGADEDAPWLIFEERLGYDKTSGRWGLSLCTVTVNGPAGEEEAIDSWLFNDAPRNLRLRAVDHVPMLIEALAKEASQTAQRVSEQADYARDLAQSISALASEKGGR